MVIAKANVECIAASHRQCLLQDIIECLGEPEVSQTEHLPLLKGLISCVTAVIQTSNDVCSEHSLLLFTITQRISGSKLSDGLQQEASHSIITSGLLTVVFL